MPTAWGGADPVEVVDGGDYELGCEFLANQDITITHVRIWTGAGEINVSGRKARVWTTGGSQLGIASLPADLGTGWSTHALDTPVERAAGTKFVVSYSTGGNYGALVDALLNSSVNSSDGAVTALRHTLATNGNGIFNTTPGVFPSTASGSKSFYGTDCQYDLGLGGNTAPSISALTVIAVGATATATVIATDAETLVGATYRYDWGDDTAVTVSGSATAQHTYTASGLYAVMVSVTDAEGLDDFAAEPVQVSVPSAELQRIDSPTIIDKLKSHVVATALFESVITHEPKHPPGNGIHGALWFQTIGPSARDSGLYLTSARLLFNLRIYHLADAEPMDDIDAKLLAVVDELFYQFSGDFSLGGVVRNLDLLGSAGAPLGAEAGYSSIGGTLYRTVTLSIAMIKNDVWEQSA